MVSREELAAWVQASCEAQDLPVRVTDPMEVERVCAHVGAADGPAARQREDPSGAT